MYTLSHTLLRNPPRDRVWEIVHIRRWECMIVPRYARHPNILGMHFAIVWVSNSLNFDFFSTIKRENSFLLLIFHFSNQILPQHRVGHGSIHPSPTLYVLAISCILLVCLWTLLNYLRTAFCNLIDVRKFLNRDTLDVHTRSPDPFSRGVHLGTRLHVHNICANNLHCTMCQCWVGVRTTGPIDVVDQLRHCWNRFC